MEFRVWKKNETESYWPRLQKDKDRGHNTWLSVDWQNFIDEDQEGNEKKRDDIPPELEGLV